MACRQTRFIRTSPRSGSLRKSLRRNSSRVFRPRSEKSPSSGITSVRSRLTRTRSRLTGEVETDGVRESERGGSCAVASTNRYSGLRGLRGSRKVGLFASYLQLVEAAGVEPKAGSLESVTYRKREALIPPNAPQTPRSGTKQVHEHAANTTLRSSIVLVSRLVCSA